MKYLSKEQMEGLTTKRLLAYLKSLRARWQWGKGYSVDDGPLRNDEAIECHAAYDMAKAILAIREHAPRGLD